MTDNHKHRTIKVKRGGLVERLLRKPTLLTSSNFERVDRSRMVWGPVYPELGMHSPAWRLTPLGLLHGVFGLTLEMKP